MTKDQTPVIKQGTCPHCGHDGEDFYDNEQDEYAWCYRCRLHSLSFYVREQTCRCDGVPMGGSDHCPKCGCEEYEETCNR